MTPLEFKSWFDGFTEALTGTPTKAQWGRIKERVAEIDGKAVTEKVFVDRYWNYPTPYYQYPYYHYPYYQRYYGSGVGLSGTCSTAMGTTSNVNAVGSLGQAVQCNNTTQTAPKFDGMLALYAAGKNEAEQFQQ